MDESRTLSEQPLVIPAIASAGAAVLHAAASGVHADHVGLGRFFIALAVVQAAVSILGFVRPDRLTGFALVGVNSGAVAGWLLTRLVGISWISGLEIAERPQLADTSAALLASVAVLATAAVLLGRSPTIPNGAVVNAAILAGVLVVPGLADATTGRTVFGVAPPDSEPAHAPGEAPDPQPATVGRPYDPLLPIDLGGTAGVTLQQQAFAENLVASTVRDLPQWSDIGVVEAAGFRSIGDALSGHEHYINFDWIDDNVILDGDFPESLVFEPQPDGSKKLVSAMYMLPSFIDLAEVPDWGGDLMQWHVHRDLCFTDDPVSPQVRGIKPVGSECALPLVDGTEAPMIHVWITPNECGPFAALDGIGGGQVPEGEEVLCDTAHGHG